MFRTFALTAVALMVAIVSAQETKKPPRKYDVSKPDSDFTKQNFAGKKMERHDLENCVFHFCDMTGVNMKSSNLRGADFGSASVDKVDMSDCYLQNSKFDRASAQNSNFDGADLSGADLSRCSVQKSTFRGATLKNLKGLLDMTGADFTGADLCGANLQDTKEYATKAIFKGAKYDKLTRWPRGFDVEASGAVLQKPTEK